MQQVEGELGDVWEIGRDEDGNEYSKLVAKAGTPEAEEFHLTARGPLAPAEAVSETE